MSKKIGLGNKLTLSTAIVVLASFLILIPIVLNQILISSQEQAQSISKLNSDYYGSKVQEHFNNVKTIAQGLSHESEAMRSQNKLSREVIIDSMKKTLNSNKDIFGVTVAYEHNMFDNNDSKYLGKPGSGKDGRFMPYITRNGNGFTTDVGIYDNYTDEQMKWYNIPKNTGKPYLTEPTTYPVNGKDVTMASVVLPIMRDNKFVGVVSIDVVLDYLQGEIKKVKPMGGYTELLSSKGIYVAHGENTKLVKQSATKDEEWRNLIKRTSKGEKFYAYGTTASTGKKILRVFSPVHLDGSDQYWSYVSIIPMDSILAQYNFLFKLMIILGVIILLAIICIQYFVINRAIKPVKAVSKVLTKMADADFTEEISKKYMKHNDEIGDLARAIVTMQTSIRELVNSVIREASTVESSSSDANNGVMDLTGDIDVVSSTTEEMSAGMEQTAASTEEMNATSTEIENAVESIAKKAQAGAEKALQINKRAEELKENAVMCKTIVQETHANVDQKLRYAIEQSKAIVKINELSDSILQITSQTNLLALNAAIEAARAGESGRGFAVVADEIRKLAEDSKNSVSQIQIITSQVISSVENLAESAEQVLDFIKSQVLKDYNSMVVIAEQYHNDAGDVDELVTDFSATSEEVLASMQNMIKAINEISSANNEAADGIQNIANKAIKVAEKANNVVNTVTLTKESSENLMSQVKKFKV